MKADIKTIFMKSLILILFFFGIQMNAQTKSKDSLVLVKEYLYELKSTVNSSKFKKSKILKMERLIRTGITQREIFERNIKRTKSKEEAEEMIRTFNFILQSAILYKNDIKKNYSGYSEVKYLNTNIPVLLQKME